jgi:hypothetical protein
MVADQDLHYFWKLDQDPHWSEKLDPDQGSYLSQNSKALEAQNRVYIQGPGAADSPSL